MSAVIAVDTYGPNDYVVHIRRAPGVGRSDRHTVDVGNTDDSRATLTTRDGFPMTVLYAVEHGYAVAVHTS
jgi:hypothetical protein